MPRPSIHDTTDTPTAHRPVATPPTTRARIAFSSFRRADTRAVVEGGVTKLYEFSYDALGRSIDETLPTGQVTDYTYDGVGNLKTLVDDDGTVTYTYDAINRQASIQEPGQSGAISYAYADTVNNTQQITITRPNGVVTTKVLDPAARLTSTKSKKGATTLQKFLYEYKLGASQQALVSKETDKDGIATNYTYDVANGLTNVTGGSTFTCAYDQAGNLTTKTAGGSTTAYRYNQGNQLCWKLVGTSANGSGSPPAGATSYAYDAAGNETGASGTRSSSYSVREQLSSLTPSGMGAVAMNYAS